jgi:hypothetical protein
VILRTGVLGGVALAALGITPAATFGAAARLVDGRTAAAIATVSFVSLGAAGSWWLHRRSARQDAAERAGDAGLPAVLAAAGYQLDPDATAVIPAVPAQPVPNFDAVIRDGIVSGRITRQMHHDVWAVTTDRQLQRHLNRVTAMPDLSAERRQWLRRELLNGRDADELLGQPWAQIDQRRRWGGRPNPGGTR